MTLRMSTSTFSTTSHNHSDGFELDKVLRNDLSIGLLTIVFFFIIIATLFGNIIVIIAILTYRQLKAQQSNLFILNLAVADISVAVTVMVWSAVAFMLDMGRDDGHPWVFTMGMCYLQCAMNYCLIVVSMMTLGFISIDRFVHIVYPLRYHEIMTVKRIRIMICWTWIQGLIIGFIPVGMKWIHYDYCEVVCAIDWTSKHADKFVIVAFITCFLAPAFTMLICYSVIFKRSLAYTAEIRRSMKLVNGSSEKNKTSFENVGSLKKNGKQQTYEVKGSSIKDGERNGKLHSSVSETASTRIRRHNSTVKESTIVKSLLIVVLVFFLCMTPFSVTKLIKVLKYHVPCWVNTLATFIQLLASACNPLIYGIFRKEYRKAFKIQYNKTCHRMQSRLASSEYSDSFSSPYYADNKVPTLKKRQMAQAAEAANREKPSVPQEDITPNDIDINMEAVQPVVGVTRVGEEKGVIQLREGDDSPSETAQRKNALARRSVSFSNAPDLVNQTTEIITL